MDGIHDCGGRQGFGPVDRDGADKAFHGRWEAAVFAMVQAAGAAGGPWTVDRFRHAIERIEPAAYLAHGYYGRWLGGVETLLVEAGILTQAEVTAQAVAMGGSASDLVAARPRSDPDPAGPAPTAANSDRAITDRAPLFAVGDRVTTLRHGAGGHTRLPGYARDRRGRITALHDGWVFPDTNAHGQGECPQFLYTVSFTSEELWQRPGFSIMLDLFEPYLTAVQ